jgi:hypothetical protein
MSDESGSDSSGESVESAGKRAARDRLAPKTQADYASALSGLAQFAFENKEQFSDSISVDKILLPVRLPLGKAYLSHLRDKLVPWPFDPRQGDERTGVKHLSLQTMNTVIQAIKYSFTKDNCPMPAADAKYYSDFPQAYKHILAQAKAEGAFPASGGALPLTMLAAIKLLEAAITYVPTGRGAAESCVQQLWLFILLAIATCARGERVARVQFQCMSWCADVAEVQIPTSKSDTLGLMSYLKMCSANPHHPLCCLITALGVEFLSRNSTQSMHFLFGDAGEPSKCIGTRLQTALKTVIRTVGATTLGVPLHRLCGHFLKKTSIAFMRSNYECVSHDSRELRADHKVGPYNLRSEQDGIVGRILAFLKPGTEQFAVTPPHFDPRIIAAIPWTDIVPGYELYPMETRPLIHACVASVIHNSEFLAKNLSLSHPYHGCRLLKVHSRWVRLLQPYVLGGRSAFKSILEQTGQSLISRLCVDLHVLRHKQHNAGPAQDQAMIDTMHDLQSAVVTLTNVIQRNPAVPSAAVASATHHAATLQLGYLPASFRFPVGLTAENCWYRWHGKDKPLRAVNSKMFPATWSAADRGRQGVLMRKMRAVMEILQGTTDNATVDLDPTYVWQACWARCVAAFEIREPCSWVLTTLYDFLLKQPIKVKAARVAPAISFADAAACAASVADKVARDAQVFAHAAAICPPARSILVPQVVPEVPANANAMSEVEVKSVIENIQLQSTHAPQLPVTAHIEPPEKGYICSHCRKGLICKRTARKHHEVCPALKFSSTTDHPCKPLKGACCDSCFVGKSYCDCDRCLAVQPYCLTRRIPLFDETAAAAAADAFRAAEEHGNLSSQAP